MIIISGNGIVTTTERQQMWMEEIERRHILYFGCHMGLGKTSQAEFLARQYYDSFLMLDAEKGCLLEQVKAWLSGSHDEKKLKKMVIIDNVTYLREDDEEIADIHKLIQMKIQREPFDMMILGRAQCPAWLRTYRLSGLLLCYGRESFLLSAKETEKMVVNSLGKMEENLSKKPEMWLEKWVEEIDECQQGFALGIDYCIALIRENGTTNAAVQEMAKKMLWEKIESSVKKSLSEEMRSCLDKAALFEHFDEDMLREIMPEEEFSLFQEAILYSSYILKDENGIYSLIDIFKEFARDRFRGNNPVGYRHTCLLAGDCCRKRYRYEEALRLYKEGQQKDALINLLEEMMEKCDGTFLPKVCYPYIGEFTQEDEERYPALLFVKIMINSYTMHKEESNRLLKKLQKLAEEEKQAGIYADARKSYVKAWLTLPHQKIYSFQEMSECYMEITINEDSYTGKIQASGGGPSIINGGIDLCGWSFWLDDVYQYMKNVMGFLIGSDGEGVAEIGMGEYYLEKNQKLKAVSYLVSGISILKKAENFRSYYAANAIMARSFLAENRIDPAKDIMEKLLSQVDESRFPQLRDNIYAGYIELLLYEGTEQARNIVERWLDVEWMQGMGNSFCGEFFISDRYQMYIMVKAYIFMEKYMDAAVLMNQLMSYAKSYNRNYYMIKLFLLNAMIEEASGADGRHELIKAVVMAAKYGYIRVIADEGAAILGILKNVDWSQVKEIPDDFESYIKSVEKETKKMAGYYPNYLKRSLQGVALSKSEKRVLQLIYSGKTNEKIADELSISLSTVKFHISNIYRKLEVKNRSQALKKAAEVGWLS